MCYIRYTCTRHLVFWQAQKKLRKALRENEKYEKDVEDPEKKYQDEDEEQKTSSGRGRGRGRGRGGRKGRGKGGRGKKEEGKGNDGGKKEEGKGNDAGKDSKIEEVPVLSEGASGSHPSAKELEELAKQAERRVVQDVLAAKHQKHEVPGEETSEERKNPPKDPKVRTTAVKAKASPKKRATKAKATPKKKRKRGDTTPRKTPVNPPGEEVEEPVIELTPKSKKRKESKDMWRYVCKMCITKSV